MSDMTLVDNGKTTTIASFIEFNKLYSLPENNKWFKAFETFLSNLQGNDIKINRLISFLINQKLLMYFLDPKGMYNTTKDANYLSLLNSAVKITLLEEIKSYKHFDFDKLPNNIYFQMTGSYKSS